MLRSRSLFRSFGQTRVAKVGFGATLVALAELSRRKKRGDKASHSLVLREKDCPSEDTASNSDFSWLAPKEISNNNNNNNFFDISIKPFTIQPTLCQDMVLMNPNVSRTLRRIKTTSSKQSVNERYRVHWDAPLGEGAYGAVYAATDRNTGEKVALKKISKSFTDDVGFQREMEAFLHLRDAGGHPNICRLHENFDEGDDYYLSLDLISGGEMFDHLIRSGPYSEADAARLVREVASAISFLHGLDCVHGDIKPENLMLSTDHVSDAVVKLIDFGCAQISTTEGKSSTPAPVGNTKAYCPPEVLSESRLLRMEKSLDIWSLGVVLYIMLVGCHPFDVTGDSEDEQIIRRIINKESPPLGDTEYTGHLSQSATDLIKRLLAWDPNERITAEELLQHPWVRGETASRNKMADSDKKLSNFRRFKSQLELQTFEQLFDWANHAEDSDVSARTSLIERSFRKFDAEQKGFLTAKDLGGTSSDGADGDEALSLSGFSDLLSEHLENKYFRKDQVVYREGEEGNEMFFINSGIVEISTKDGFKVLLKQGDFVGEGALLSPNKVRSATVRCVTPVHAIEVSREYFEKYLASSEMALSLKMRETDKSRALNRTKTILREQHQLRPFTLSKGDCLYKVGGEGRELYILEKGKVDVYVDDHTVFSLKPGDMCGEHSLITGRPYGTTAACISNTCKVHVMKAEDFHEVLRKSPSLKESLQHVSLRREFQKAVVFGTKKPFPKTLSDLKHVFEATDLDGNGSLSLEEIRALIKRMDPTVPEDEINGILKSLDIDESGTVDFDEFTHIFGHVKSKEQN